MNKSSAMRRSLDPKRIFRSPLSQGRNDCAYDNLGVYCLKAPDEKLLDTVGAMAAAGHAGAFADVVQMAVGGQEQELQELDIGSVGLQQILELDTVCFLIYGCSRAFTHGMVRTRKGAWYLQQTLRHTDMGIANMRVPEYIITASQKIQEVWADSVSQARYAYVKLIAKDVPYQDARTVLPLATETWIIAGMPFRTWLDTYAYRACNMFYPEMRWVFGRMKEELAKKAPRLAEQARITCELKKRCTYRGAEDTSVCDFPWSSDREWTSPLYDDAMLKLDALKGR